MKERTEQAIGRSGGSARPPIAMLWWLLPAGVLLGLVLVLAFSIAPYLFSETTLETEVRTQVRATTGLALAAPTRGRFELLPRPRVVMGRLRITNPGGSLRVDADGLDGDVRLLPLLVGRIELASATLTRPRMVVDLDRRSAGDDSLLARAASGNAAARGAQRLGTLTLTDGTIALKSAAFPQAPAFSSVNLTLDWRDIDSPATLTGSVRVRDTTVELAAWVAQPSSIMRGDHSAVALHVHGEPLDLSANGDVASAATTTFRGHVTASAPSIAHLLHLLGDEPVLLSAFSNVALNSDANVEVDADDVVGVDLPNLTFHADGNAYEGTLAFKSGAMPSLSGTLATDRLNLTPFLTRAPKLTDAHGAWSGTTLLTRPLRPLALDLRISASHMKLPPFAIDDAALSVITRDDRTEIALAEGTAYGGSVKGRLSVGASQDGISLRGIASLAEVDAAALTWDMFGRQLAAGTLSGGFNFEAAGDSTAALMRSLAGSIKGTVADGEITGVDFGRALRDGASGKPEAALLALHGGRTTFHALTVGARVAGGIATLSDATLDGDDAHVVLRGSSDIGARRLDLDATAAVPKDARPRFGFGLEGRYERILVSPEPPSPVR